MKHQPKNKHIIDFFKANWILVLILLLSLFVRLYGDFPGYSENHPDEILGYGTAVHMFYNNLEPNSFDYGGGRPLILLIVFKLLFLPIQYAKLLFTNSELFLKFLLHGGAHSYPEYSDILFGRNLISALYWGRYINAVVGALTVVITYLLAKIMFNKRVGLLAAFFLAFNFRHVLSSHIGVPDVFNGFFTAFSLYASFLLFKKNTTRNYLFAGLIAGICVSIKYQFFHLFPLFLAHLFWVYKTKRFSYLFDKKIFLAGFVVIVIFAILNPFLIFNLEQFFRESRYNYLRYQMGIVSFRPYSYFYLYHWGLGEIISIASILGGIVLLFKEKIRLFFLLFFIAPFFFFMTIYSVGGIYTRNFTTVIPLVVIIAAYFFDWLYKFLKVRNVFFAYSILFVLIAVANFTQTKDSFVLSYYYAKPRNSDVLVKWIEDYILSEVVVRNYPLDLSSENRTILNQAIQNKNIKMLPWSYNTGPSSLAEFQEEEIDFAIINDAPFQSITYWWRLWTFDSMIKYSDVPFDFIMNGFHGLSLAELMNYSVAEFYKPYQAVSANNYLVFKIPGKITDVGERINEFHFNSEEDTWTLTGELKFSPGVFNFVSSDGKEEEGSIAITGGGQVRSTSRIASFPIPVMPGKIYTVRGWIKNAPIILDVEKDAFLRLDFYNSKEDLGELGTRVAISARVPISDEWVLREVSAKASKEAQYMTVSFQREIQTQGFLSYLDDVEVFEGGLEPVEKFKEIPYIKPTIQKEDIYSNSFL
ncbi:hypothetical protein COW99_01820 [Candidatus Roizmanbacteria bacterium CG22_combo_CG10-13_8_21_14_all_38_20]|uniref:Glycosyltransferase RgtA/B/C/D-like domain-containing protein n=1 Tax=Candidatus Roizmanbacteria bacterium CG22_combo_CG10-13_8_21_14_all_38_20 TaxID=1974862 RepID=A0A2H0BW82_9BACT|nr:phospholipid carrier-dependent glycosyltransferase [Candidatus Microgenomates bacterium]PIP61943.1 MAG: hypothetical protein COW99_01820 [Candidatus Roizmanbacteria bacterium CG22_combo_CG10-13_8_21_14_all_38_20]PJC32082.1 MAG: hypothetical protein CO050_01135 [Candidatus Roizmanbacteria bacterium CG_4_9_14_0_2_um_filter_38_17]